MGAAYVRGALVRTGYRRTEIERLHEVEIASHPSLELALQACILPLVQHGESTAVAVPGDQAFLHRLKLPNTALKQLDEVLPYELEAQVPVDIADLVHDHRLLRRGSATDPLVVLTAAARQETVRARIDLVRAAAGREPERVGCGPLPLANLVRLLPEAGLNDGAALVDLGGRRTEVLVVAGGEPVFARTLSRGTEGLPDAAPQLAAELRQTFAAYHAQASRPITTAYLLGGGATAEGAEAYLAHALGISVSVLPPLQVTALNPEHAPLVPRFAKAIALALSLTPRPLDLDLRQGSLSYQRGYGFLKEKVPLLSGLAAAIFISFLFSTWAELRALDREQEALEAALGAATKDAFNETTTDPALAIELLEKAKGGEDADPMPHLDGFGVMVELSKVVPASVTHDVEELDLQRGHVKLNGVAGSTADAQLIATELGKHPCFKDVKVAKVTQVVNSDRQKYVLEFDVRCPDDAGAKKAKKKKAEGAAEETP